MRMSNIVLIIFSFWVFSISLHACNARRLENGGFGRLLDSQTKAAAIKDKLNMDSTGDKSHDGAMVYITQNQKEMTHREELAVNISGNEIVESSSHVGLLKATRKIEDPGWKGSGRVLLEHGSHGREEVDDDTYNSAYYSSTLTVHEVREQTDYEPPHKKTPVHNK